MKTVLLILLITLCSFTGIHAQLPRLIATAVYSYNYDADSLFIIDSTAYTYTGANGGIAYAPVIDFTTSTYYLYNWLADTPVSNRLTLQTFDSHNNLTSITIQNWDTLHQTWVNQGLSQFLYDGSYNDTLLSSSIWNAATSQWKPSGQDHFTYNNNLLTYHLGQGYDSASQQYINESQDSFYYISNNLLTEDVTLYWDQSRNVWAYAREQNWYYNAARADSIYLQQAYDSASSQWNYIYMAIQLYNADTLVDSIFQASYSKNGWDTTQLDIYSYDNYRNEILDLQLYHDSATGIWDTVSKTTFVYNIYNEAIFSETFTYFYSWLPENATYFHYQDYTAGLPGPVANNNMLQLYPNPSNNIVQVNATLPNDEPVQLTLYNILGQQVWSWNAGTAKGISAQIPVSNLPAGVYTLTVEQDGFIRDARVVVAKR